MNAVSISDHLADLTDLDGTNEAVPIEGSQEQMVGRISQNIFGEIGLPQLVAGMRSWYENKRLKNNPPVVYLWLSFLETRLNTRYAFTADSVMIAYSTVLNSVRLHCRSSGVLQPPGYNMEKSHQVIHLLHTLYRQ